MRKAGAVLVAAALLAALGSCAPAAVVVGETALGTTALRPAVPIRTVQPAASRHIWAALHLSTHERALDACKGPVAVDIGPGRPTLIVEHDYCGGSRWIAPLQPGDTVELSGLGVRPGLYQVTGRKLLTRGKARVRDLPPGQVILQTCVSKTKQVEVSAVMVMDAVAR